MAHPDKQKPGLAVSIGAALSAVSGFAILLIGARALPPAENAIFLSFWSALFLVTGMLAGIQQEVTRATSSAPSGEGYSPFGVTFLAGLAVGVAVLAASPVLSPAINGGHFSLWPVLLIAVSAVLFALQMTASGSLGGAQQWVSFGLLTSGEATVRVIFVVGVAVMGLPVLGFECATALAFFFWLVFLLSPARRFIMHSRVHLPRRDFSRNIISAMSAAGATAFLVNGFPFLMAISTPAAEYRASADLVIAVSVTRAPILLPLFAFQAVVVAHYVRHPDERRSLTRKLVLALAALAALLIPTAMLIGSPVMGLVFGQAYANTPLVLGTLVAAAVLLALLVLGGTITIALNRYRDCLIGWYASVVVALVVMLALPLPLVHRTLLTLSIAPIVGAVIHFRAILNQPQ